MYSRYIGAPRALNIVRGEPSKLFGAIDAIIAQIEDLAKDADETGRQKIQDALREAQHALETPFQTLTRLASLHLEISAARVGVDLGLFSHLAASEKPLSVESLTEKSGAAPELLGRILRYLASIGLITETGQDKFTVNSITKLLTEPNAQGLIYQVFDGMGPLFQELPDFLAETKYQDIMDSDKTVFQRAFKTDLPMFAWLQQRPKEFERFQRAMKVPRAADWLSSFPVEEQLGSSWSASPDKPLFVDLGGGFGHQCIGFRDKYPNLKGRIILQDLPETLEHMQPIERVESMAQDIFQPQAIKGAKFYYLRQILHDWPDDKCVTILQNLVPALAADGSSRILIDDVALPNSGVHWQATFTDLAMMAGLGAKERRRAQWDAVIERAGLRVERMHTYAEIMRNSIVVVAAR